MPVSENFTVMLPSGELMLWADTASPRHAKNRTEKILFKDIFIMIII